MTILRDDLDAGRVDLSDVTTGETIPPVSPGEVLREEFLTPMALSAKRLALEIGVPTNRITAILHGTRALTAETAILLSRRFGNSAEFWLGLQMGWDLARAREALAA
ncbi:HigA family addiction module antitoxin [Muricoccus aerilatus]|uniref:HigA family addiction module antitoxin n=1 Tax=Muricoccus aerilatus TaxID=452982 RepID=UPI0009FDB6F2|nr:HigA family addiction module antitoxin [Roseomonas aerilata]